MVKDTNFFFLRYEDLSADLLTTAKRIYEFIGHEIPAELLTWIEQSQKETRTGGTYSTVRNSKAAMTAWRKYISIENVSEIIPVLQSKSKIADTQNSGLLTFFGENF